MNLTHHATLLQINSPADHQLDFARERYEIFDRYYEKFGIDDARSLVARAYSRPANTEELLVIVRADFITHEAQNALLKVLEEPPVSTKFIFLVPRDFSMLPTLSSRFSFYQESTAESSKENLTYKEFAEAGYKDRITQIDKATKAKDLSWQREVKIGLINFLKNNGAKVSGYKEMEYVSRTLLTRGASNKMLFEHLALMLNSR